jgi:hypothetical protein
LARFEIPESATNFHGYTEKFQPELLQNRKIIKWALPNFEVNLLYGDNGTAESITVYFSVFLLDSHPSASSRPARSNLETRIAPIPSSPAFPSPAARLAGTSCGLRRAQISSRHVYRSTLG